MRKIILCVAVSLDGYIEGPRGEFDWCFTDQDYGMAELFERVDSLVMGRKTYEMMQGLADGGGIGLPDFRQYVFSNSLSEVKPGAVLIKSDLLSAMEKIRQEEGKDIWLFGGAVMITSFIDLGLVDEFLLAVHPVLLGGGKPLCGKLKERSWVDFVDVRTYDSGLVMLKYHSRKT
jgi:dihydrofolate reductase